MSGSLAFGTTLAAVTAEMVLAPARRKARAAAISVAPLVKTSSTRMISRPATSSEASNAPERLRNRASKPRPFCWAVGLVRLRSSGATAWPVSRAAPRASTRD